MVNPVLKTEFLNGIGIVQVDFALVQIQRI